MTRPAFALLLCTAAAALSPVIARAQVPAAPDVDRLRMKIGPVYFDPTLALTNAGVDTNVFNDPDSASPKKDFNITITPQTTLWMPVGRTWLNGAVREDIVWYKKYSSERSVNGDYKVNWLVPLTRLSFVIGGDKVHTHDRPGYEIDARAPRNENAVNGAIEIRALTKTFFGARAERRTTSFSEDAEFLGTNLETELNRTVTVAALTVRNQLTPLTSLNVDVAREQDRFDFDHLRDSDSTAVTAGLKFDQLALIKGGLMFGFRDFSPLVAGVPSFRGLTTAVNLSYVLLGSTRFAFATARDVQYSFDVNQPYYVQTNFTASVAQQIYGPLDVEARVGAARLAYRTREGAIVDVSDRVDHARSYGGGVGYHMGRSVRLAFNVDDMKRESAVESLTYHGLKYGTAITYGF